MLRPCPSLPCRAAKALHSAAVSDSHLPCHAHAVPMPCSEHDFLLKATAQHGRRVTACGLLSAFGFFRLPRRVLRSLLSEAYQSSSQRSIPTAVKSSSSTLQKRRSVKLMEQQFRYFRLPRGLSRRTRYCRSMGGARRGMCGLTTRHGR
jgi:hypothetical protein